jgi:peroxiredoxin
MTISKAAADWLYRDNELNEPWVFVIGADGRITARFDNVVTRDELEPLLKALPVIGKA